MSRSRREGLGSFLNIQVHIYKTPIATLDFLEYSSLKANFEYFKICRIVGDSERKHVEEIVVAQAQHFTEFNQ